MSEEEILDAFGDADLDDAVVAKLVSLCYRNDLQADQILTKWELYSMKRSNVALTIQSVEEFAKTLQSDANSARAVASSSIASAARKGGKSYTSETLSNVGSIYGSPSSSSSAPFVSPASSSSAAAASSSFSSQAKGYSTPQQPARSVPRAPGATPSYSTPSASSSSSASQPSPSQKYLARTDSGKVIASHIGPSFDSLSSDYAASSSTPILISADAHSEKLLRRGATFMDDDLDSRSTYLDERVDAVGQQIVEKHDMPVPSSLSDLSEEERVFVGRIVCESAEGRLNDNSMLLEGSMSSSIGCIMKLNTYAAPQFSTFPGQIVAVKGFLNHEDGPVVAQDIQYDASSFTPSTPIPTTEPVDHTLTIMVAAGPFCTMESPVSFRPLEDLLARASATKPNLLILLGPFLDFSHPDVRSFKPEADSSVLLGEQLNLIRKSLAQNVPSCKCVVVSSFREASVTDCVFPQAAYDDAAAAESTRLKLYPNPTFFSAGGLTIGATSVDIIRHMASDEISVTHGRQQRASGPSFQTDRMARLGEHLLQQKSFYPLFPPAAEVPFDSTLSEALTLPCSPDLLIVPSDLHPFVKFIGSSTICLNPRRLCSGDVGGTYAIVRILPAQASEQISARTKVEIIKV